MKTIGRLLAPVLILGAGLLAQRIDQAPANRAKKEPQAANAPEGMTREQAERILSELRQIRELLQKQQNDAARSDAAPAAKAIGSPEKVNVKMGEAWYSLGHEDAPLTLLEFADYQCSYCRRFHSETFAALKKNYIDTGKVRFISRDFPLEIHAQAVNAAEAARCAGDQGRFWDMRNILISNSNDLSPDAILKYAQSIPLDMSSFRACVETQKYKAQIQQDQADGSSMQVYGTPTFVLGKTTKDTLSGIVIVGAQPYSAFDAAIQQMLKVN